MSVCIGLLHKDFVILASDSRGTFDTGKYNDKISKIIEIPNGGALLIAGTLGAGQKLARLLGTHNNPLDVPHGDIPDEPPHCVFMTKERKLLEIDSGFGVWELSDGDFICIGCGGEIAQVSIMKQLGKKKITSLDYKTCVKVISTAIQDACNLNLYCGGEIVVKSYKRA